MGKKGKKSAEKDSTEGPSTPSFICPTPTEQGSDQYDVFLSFRGPDTRNTFADHLYCNLVKASIISVFRDMDSIPIGEEFDSQILDAISRSKISIPIISENYASSKWCLCELVRMMELKKSTPHVVLPIFYKVKPADVRRLQGKFGDAFSSSMKYFDQEEIPKYKRALEDVSYLQAWESEKIADGKQNTRNHNPSGRQHQWLAICLQRTRHSSLPKLHHHQIKVDLLLPMVIGSVDEDQTPRVDRVSVRLQLLANSHRHEGELVQKVVDAVLSELRRDFQLDVTKHLVGIDDHVYKIRNWALSPTTHARMIGIYGMGGIGKTTLAKAIYNELSKDFVGRSYLPDIRDAAHRNGIHYVQNQLIKDILPNECEASKGDHGINLIKSRFKFKKVIIILDDIDDRKQLHALARERDWFTAGSIIIVTTRYEAVLDQSEFEVDYKYPMNKLDEVHSVLLFNKHAFRMNCSSGNFEDISRRIVFAVDGLPLALEVVGSYLFRKTDPNVWNDTLKQLQKQPHEDVQAILKISYDALRDEHKEIFLDIACFFIGKKRKFAMYMWDDCGFYASQGIEELKLRCLIKIGYYGELMMHDQLRDLGRSIVGKVQPPEKPSRLWLYQEASTVLMENKGTKEIKAICLDKYYGDRSWHYWPTGHPQTYTNEQFVNLPRLRFLRLREAVLSGDFNKLFSELRWLQWFGIDPDQPFMATNLHLQNLVVLQLSRNPLTNDWGAWSSMMAARRLKVLDLAYCRDLRCTPDLSACTELEILILEHCDKLAQVHPSIGKVKSLVSLDLSYCGNLVDLPEEFGELEELKELILDRGGIKEIPKSIGSLRKLEKLSASNCKSLTEISNSIGNLSSLQHLDLSGCKSLKEIPTSIGDLQDLQQLDMTYSAIKRLPSDIGRLKRLRRLILNETPISDLPDSIQNLSSLQQLCLYSCKKLRSLPDLPSTLTYLRFTCQSRTLPPLSHLSNLQELCIFYCHQLESIPKLPSRLLKLYVGSCSRLILPELDGLEYLEELSINRCPNVATLDLSQNNRLKQLHAEDCRFLVEIKGLDNLQSLEKIFVDHCETIPRLIFPELQGLKRLTAYDCDKLVEIRGLDKAKCLEMLDITGCELMETLPDLSRCEKLNSLGVRDCKKLTQLQGLEKLNLSTLDIVGCDSLEMIPQLPGTYVNRDPSYYNFYF